MTSNNDRRDGDQWVYEMRGTRGNIVYTGGKTGVTGAQAWFRLPYRQWAWRSEAKRGALLDELTNLYAALAGHRVTLRVTSRLYNIADWASYLTRHSRPDSPADWTRIITAVQRHLAEYGHVYLKETLIGVNLGPRRPWETLAKTREKWTAENKRISALVGRLVAADPLSPADLEWLIRRSVALGLPQTALPFQSAATGGPNSSGVWSPRDVSALSSHVWHERDGRAVHVTGSVLDTLGVRDVDGWVAVTTLGPTQPISVPEAHAPWMHYAEQLGFPVDVAANVSLLTPDAARKKLAAAIRKGRDQESHYAELGLEPDEYIAAQLDRARELDFETRAGGPDAVRGQGWVRFAVAAPTKDECLERMAELTNHYKAINWDLTQPENPDLVLREFVPGEGTRSYAHLRRFGVRWLAAGVPHAASDLGDGQGMYTGYKTGLNPGPVFIDPHYATQVANRSGMALLIAEPGAGKTTLGGFEFYAEVQRGHTAAFLDPGGTAAPILDLPEMRDTCREINLAHDAPDGSTAPYALVPMPTPDQYGRREDYERAVTAAVARRQKLAHETLFGWLPPDMQTGVDARMLIREAVSQTGGHPYTTLWSPVDYLASMGDRNATSISRYLEQLAGMSNARLALPPRPVKGRVQDDPQAYERVGRQAYEAFRHAGQVRGTLVSMPGMDLPRGALKHATDDQLVNLSLLNLAAELTARIAYTGRMADPKFLLVDEGHVLGKSSLGQFFMQDAGRQGRRRNLATWILTQNPEDVALFGADFANLAPAVFVGRVADNTAVAERALELLGVPVSPTLVNALATLNDGEFVYRDADGLTERFQVDLGWHPELLRALNTTPGAVQRRPKLLKEGAA